MPRTNKQSEAAEQELQTAEAEYAKLHPLASQGNYVAPITRGELRIILEDLLTKLASGDPIKLQKDEKAIGDVIMAGVALDKRVAALEKAVAALAPAPAAASPAQLSFQGKDQILALGRTGMEEFAKTNCIDIAGVGALPDDGLAEYIAANMNLKS